MQEETYKVKITLEKQYKVEVEKEVEDIHVLMLKGEKGDPANVINDHSSSTTEAYSANYVNGHFTAGSGTIGSPLYPIYLDNGTIKRCNVWANGNNWGRTVMVDGSGVMEAGKYIDFHNTASGTSDFDARLEVVGTNILRVSNTDSDFQLPSPSGTPTVSLRELGNSLFEKRYQNSSNASSYNSGWIYLGSCAANDNGANFYSMEIEGRVGGFVAANDAFKLNLMLANRPQALAKGYLIGPSAKINNQFDVVAYQDTNATTGQRTRWYLHQKTNYASVDIAVRYHTGSSFSDRWSFTKSSTEPSGVKVYSLTDDITTGGKNVIWFDTTNAVVNGGVKDDGITTSMIQDAAVTSDKIDFTTTSGTLQSLDNNQSWGESRYSIWGDRVTIYFINIRLSGNKDNTFTLPDILAPAERAMTSLAVSASNFDVIGSARADIQTNKNIQIRQSTNAVYGNGEVVYYRTPPVEN